MYCSRRGSDTCVFLDGGRNGLLRNIAAIVLTLIGVSQPIGILFGWDKLAIFGFGTAASPAPLHFTGEGPFDEYYQQRFVRIYDHNDKMYEANHKILLNTIFAPYRLSGSFKRVLTPWLDTQLKKNMIAFAYCNGGPLYEHWGVLSGTVQRVELVHRRGDTIYLEVGCKQ